MAYTKLFNSIVTSTIWTEDNATRIVWITMLAIADKNGEVQGSVPGLARIAGVAVDDCRVAITKFLSPDPDSRTKDDEGRRIQAIDGGWELLNFRKYRDMASKEDMQAMEAARKARYRAKIARNVPEVSKCPVNVPNVPELSTVNPHIADSDSDSDSDLEAISHSVQVAVMGNAKGAALDAPKRAAGSTRFAPPSEDDVSRHAVKLGMSAHEATKFRAYYESNGWRVGKNPMKNWKAAMVNWRTNYDERNSGKGYGQHRITEAERRRDAADPTKNGGIGDPEDAPDPFGVD